MPFHQSCREHAALVASIYGCGEGVCWWSCKSGGRPRRYPLTSRVGRCEQDAMRRRNVLPIKPRPFHSELQYARQSCPCSPHLAHKPCSFLFVPSALREVDHVAIRRARQRLEPTHHARSAPSRRASCSSPPTPSPPYSSSYLPSSSAFFAASTRSPRPAHGDDPAGPPPHARLAALRKCLPACHHQPGGPKGCIPRAWHVSTPHHQLPQCAIHVRLR